MSASIKLTMHTVSIGNLPQTNRWRKREKLHSLLEIDLGANVIFLKSLDVVCSGSVEVVDISLVMFGMMNLHNLAGNVRF